MAYTPSSLQVQPVGPGSMTYFYRTTADSMATVATSGYFTSGAGTAPTGSGPALAANDLVYCQCTDGNLWLKVSSVSATTGAATTQYAGGNLPIQTWATGTAAGDFGMKVGFYEVGTTIATGSRGVLPVPYPGAEVRVRKIDSGTQAFEFDAGGCASAISWVNDLGTAGAGGTAMTYDGTNRRITLRTEAEGFHVVASSTSRWRLHVMDFNASGDGCASVLSEGASFFLAATV